MDRPTIFNETINKKTSNRNKSTMSYEHGMLSQENRVFVEQTINDLKKTKAPTGYNGTPIIQEVFNFEQLYPGLTFKDPDLLYDRMMNDARNVFPRNRDLKIMVNNYYNQAIHNNLNNIYHYAPRFFSDNFIPKTGVNNAAFESYQVYIYLLCFIHFTDTHQEDVEVRELDNLDKILNWIATRRDPSIEYIINGPTSNSSLQETDFRSHYRTLIDNSNDMSEIIAYNQLSSTQTISSDLYKLMHLISSMPNVYFKQPDEARKYNINIDTSQGVKVKIDNEMNLIFDCSYVNLGDVTEQNKLAKFENLESIITNNKVNSMINTKKLAELFHQYSRIKILELVITPDTYISALDAFAKVFVVFKGVSCSERNIYNTIETNFLKIGGKFNKTNRGYEFVQDVDAITYKSVLADVKGFEVYLTLDPSVSNKIVPNEYSLTIQKDKIYNHPITTDVIYDAKVRGQKKLLTVVEAKQTVQTKTNDDLDFNFWFKPDITKIVPELIDNTNSKLVINEKSITSTDWISQIKLNQHKLTLAECLYRRWSSGDIVTNLHAIIDFIWELRQLYNDVYISSLLEQLSKIVNSALRSEILNVNDLILKLSINSPLTDDEKAIISDSILNCYELFNENEREHLNSHIVTSNYTKEVIETILNDLQNDSPLSESNKALLNNIIINSETLSNHDKYTLTNSNTFTQEQKQLIYKLFSTLNVIDSSSVNVLESKLSSNKQVEQSYTNEELKYISEFANHTSELSLNDLFVIITSLNNLNTEQSKNEVYNIIHHQPIDTIQVINSINLFADYSTIKSNIIDDINNNASTWSVAEYSSILSTMIERSLIIDDKTSLLTIVDTPTHIYESSEKDAVLSVIQSDPELTSELINKIKSYNSDINFHNTIVHKANTYKSANELMRNPSASIEQLKSILSKFDSTLSNSVNISDVINFITILNKLTLFTYEPLSDLDVMYEFVNKNSSMLFNFFNNVSDKLSTVSSNISNFINSYLNLINNIDNISTNYNSYFKPIFKSETNCTITTIKQLITVLQIYIDTYTLLYNQLGFNKSYTSSTNESTINYIYRTVPVDTTNATIEGKYFTVDGNGFATLGASSPDTNYLIYTEEENDLMLINLYRKFSDVIKTINNSSFIYSENLSTIQNLAYNLETYTGAQNKYKFDNNYILNDDGKMYYEYHELVKSNIYNINNFNININFENQVEETNVELFDINSYVLAFNVTINLTNESLYNIPFTLSNDDVTMNGTCNIVYIDSNASTGYSTYVVNGLIENSSNGDLIGLIFTADINYKTTMDIDNKQLNNTNKGMLKNIVIVDNINGKTNIDGDFNITFDNLNNLNTINDIVEKGEIINNEYSITFDNPNNNLNKIIYSYNPTTSTLTINNKQTSSTNTIRETKLIINIVHKTLINTESGKLSENNNNSFIYTNSLIITDSNDATNISNIVSFNDYQKEPNKQKSNLYKSFIISDLDPKCDYWNRTAYVASLMLCPIESCFDSNISLYSPSHVLDDVIINGKTENIVIYGYSPKFTVYSDTFKITNSDILIDNGGTYISSGLTSIYVNANKSVNIYRNQTSSDEPIIISLINDKLTQTVSWGLYDSEDVKSTTTVPEVTFYADVTFDYNHVVNFKIYDGNKSQMLINYQNSIQSGIPFYITINDYTYEVVISFTVTESDGIDVDAGTMVSTINLESITMITIKYSSVVYYKDIVYGNMLQREFETMKFSNVPSKYTPSSDVMFALTGNYTTKYKLHPIFKYAEKCFVIPRFVDSNNKFVMVAEKYNQNVMTKPVYLRSQYDLNSTTNNTIQDSDTVNYKIFPRSDPNKTHLMESINKDLVMIGTVDNAGYVKDVAITAGYVHAIPSSSKMMMSIEFS